MPVAVGLGQRYFHLAARVVRGSAPASSYEVGAWLWPRMRETFPKALGAVLMPDHAHVVGEGDAQEARVALARVLGNCARGPHPVATLRWTLSDDPSSFTDTLKVSRNVRYVALNPVRAGLVDDPLEWTWSTHRDLVGAVADPWVTSDRLARALGWSTRRVQSEWHTHVSRDGGRATSPQPTPFEPHLGELDGEAPLSWIAAAAAAATRGHPNDIKKRGPTRAIYLALTQQAGWRSTSLIAERCDMTTRAVRAAWAQPHPPGLQAALLCLGDPRLR